MTLTTKKTGENLHFQDIKRKLSHTARKNETETVSTAKHCATQTARAQIHWWPQGHVGHVGIHVSV